MITTMPVYDDDRITGYVSLCSDCGKWWNTADKTGARERIHECQS